MASQGPNNASVASQGSGSYAWSTPLSDVYSSNNVHIKTSGYGSGYTYDLKVSGFGFTIPAGATIDGILVEIERKKVGSVTGVKDVSVKIIKSDGTLGTTNKADTATEWPTSDAYKSYGGATDLWGETWDDTKINNANFGVYFIGVQQRSGKNHSYPYVDHIRITVYYTEGGSSSAIKSVNGLAKASVKSVNGLAIASVKNINGLA